MERILENDNLYYNTEELQGMLYKQYYKAVFRTIYYIVYDKEIAKDLTNDTFIKAFEKIGTLRDNDKVKQWLCVIASNLAKNYIRKNSKIIPLDNMECVIDSYDFIDDSPQKNYDEKEKKQLVREAINQLDKESKQVIFLRYYLELSYENISKNTSLNIGTVKSRINRAKSKLFNILKIEGENDGGL